MLITPDTILRPCQPDCGSSAEQLSRNSTQQQQRPRSKLHRPLHAPDRISRNHAMPHGNRRPLYSDGEAGEAGSAPAPSPPPPAAGGAPPVAVDVSPPRQADQQAPSFKQPCTFKGLASAAYAGALGYFLGFVPAAIRFKGRQWGAIHAQGMGSASQLALMSGMYTAVHCICQRIRLVEDGWNRGLAGCSTGLVLGWRSGGPWSALQSCVGLGAISALIDLGGGAVEAAEAALLADVQQLSGQLAAQQQQQQQLACSLPALPGLQQLAAVLGERRAAAALAQQQRCMAAPTLSAQPQGVPAQPWQALQPALDVVQQVVAASPLMFLGACCQSGAGTPAAAATSGGGAAGQLVDACGLRQQQPRRRQPRRRRQEQQQ